MSNMPKYAKICQKNAKNAQNTFPLKKCQIYVKEISQIPDSNNTYAKNVPIIYVINCCKK